MAPHSPPSPRSPRKPLPQPVEETKRSNRASPTNDLSLSPSSSASSKKPSRLLPQPVETSITHSKKPSRDHASREDSHNSVGNTSTKPSSQPPMEPQSPSQTQKPRRFAPQMIETPRRRRKSTDPVPDDQAHLPKHMRQARPSAVPIAPENSPVVSSDQVPQAPESKFSSSKLAEKQDRRHSFRVPDLPAIASQSGTESNNSSPPSRSTSPSAESDQTEQGSNKKKRKSRARRESQDAQWSGYLLSLAAKTAERQLRDQAMAAYPNEHAHEPVDHYAIDRDSEEAEVEVGVGKLQMDGPADEEVADRSPVRHRHRDSAAGFDLAEMRKHQEKLEQQRRDQWAVDPSDLGRRKSTRRALQEAEDAQKGAEIVGAPSKDIIGWQKDNEMTPMQKAASPPMAGQNLKFPKFLSPQATRLDVNQYPGIKKPSDSETRQNTGLWTPGGDASRRTSVNGLWNGVCNIANQEALAPPKVIQTGLLTPGVERGDPFSASKNYGQTQLPPSPPSSQEENNLDTILRREQSLENELNDTFVSQVYNYLSLGYPSLARKFDPELSKITRVSVDELRKDDDRCNAKGYVGAPEGTGADVRGVLEGDQKCERWCALKLYVREWGRQQPNLGGAEELEGGWGARARKGSWGI